MQYMEQDKLDALEALTDAALDEWSKNTLLIWEEPAFANMLHTPEWAPKAKQFVHTVNPSVLKELIIEIKKNREILSAKEIVLTEEQCKVLLKALNETEPGDMKMKVKYDQPT